MQKNHQAILEEMETENGWIKLHRKITEWEWYDDGNTFRTFIHLLLTVNFTNSMYKGRMIKRGQRLTSIRKLASELNIDEKTVQRCLHNLESTKEIKTEPTKSGTLIMVRKYDDYQDVVIDNVGIIPTPTPTPTPTHIPTPTPTQNKNNKNNKNEKNSIELSDDSSLSGCDATPTEQKHQECESINYEGLVNYFNSKTNGIFGMLRLPISDKRKQSIKARIREHGKEAFAKMIQMAIDSNFLKGQNPRGWTATFDWLIKPTNFEKVLSGNFTNHSSDGSQSGRDMIGSEFTND